MSLKGIKYLLFAAAFLLFSRIVPAQTLPQLSPDARIQRGTLGCGAAYYMVKNPTEKGFTDVALIQRESSASLNPESLDLPFLSRMGILPGPEGFLSGIEGNAVYHFPRIASYKAEVLDSTLLYAFSRMALSDAPQAIVVSGDIDAVDLKKKMDIFSMMVPRLKPGQGETPYVWMPTEAPRIVFRGGKTSSVGASYASERIPHDQMNTAQALVTDMFYLEFGTVLRHRLEMNLREENIPFSAIRFARTGSDATAGDESAGVTIVTEKEWIPEAQRVLSRTLGELATYGTSETEFAEAKEVLSPSVLKRADAVPSNAEFVARCTANFLYGANLAPFAEEARLFARKNVSEAVEAGLFGSFSSALLQQLRNLTLTVTAPPDSLTTDDALFQYNLGYLYGWAAPSGRDYSWHGADTLGLEPRAVPRLRIKSEKAEPLSGGTLWTLTNGIRVVYKQIKGSGAFQYALQLNGGLSHIPGLKEGEGGYIGDILSLYDAGGLRADAFRDLLSANSVSMDAHVDLTGMNIRGSAPQEKLALVFKALTSLVNEGTLNPQAFDYYVQCEKMRPGGLDQRLDALISPRYQYSSAKLPESLTEETAEKARKYFGERFSRINDGVFILTGDVDPGVVKKMVVRYFGAFQTTKSSPVSRKQVHFRTLSGTNTYSEEGLGEGVYVLMDAEYPFTAMNYLSTYIVREAVRQKLSAHLNGGTVTVNTKVRFFAYPQERIRLTVECRPVTPGVQLMSVMTQVRAALQVLPAQPVSSKDLTAWKQLLYADMQAAMASPDDMLTLLLVRYSAGKDLVSRYKENINAITAAQVGDMLKALTQGGRIEYIAP